MVKKWITNEENGMKNKRNWKTDIYNEEKILSFF